MIKRYDISAYCYKCGSAEGTGAVEVEYDEDNNGCWVGYHDHVTSLNFAQQLKDEILPLLKDALEEFSDRKFNQGKYMLDKAMAKLSSI